MAQDHIRRTCVISIAFFTLLTTPSLAADGLRPRARLIKPAHTRIDEHHAPDLVWVKFQDDLPVRLRQGVPSDPGTGVLDAAQDLLAAHAGGTWERVHTTQEQRLADLRDNAERNLGREIADLNTEFLLKLPPGVDLAEAVDAYNALDCVELATPWMQPAPPPLPPNFQGSQVYENASPAGVSAEATWGTGITGAGVKICDLEYSWNLDHLDLPPTTLLGFDPFDPFADENHGTAVLGEMAGIDNGWGVTGIAYDAEFFVAGVHNGGSYNVGAGITNALQELGAGDVILIEQQTFGPNGGNFVPVEWVPSYYNAIVTAVGNGVVVVEAAGNGGENLDAPIYSTGNGGHHPFLLENDSGAIIVGAGAAASGGSDVPRSRLSFSCYGVTVDLQGWGQAVTTTGYGGLYFSEGVNLYYTPTFSGTSSASPIVAGACALLQSAFQTAFGQPLSPLQTRDFLRDTGAPQQSGNFPASQNIGPLPDAESAILAAVVDCDPGVDCNGNGSADGCDLVLGVSLDCNDNGVPDECDIAGGFSDDSNGNGVPDECDIPENDDCGSPIIVDVGVTTFTTLNASTDGTADSLCGVGGDAQIDLDIWFRYTAICNGQITIDLCGSSFDTQLAVYEFCPIAANQAIACDDDACGLQSQVSFPGTTGTHYLIRVGGHNDAFGPGQMTVTAVTDCIQPPSNDDCGSSLALGEGMTAFSTLGATTDGPDESGQCDVNGQIDNDVWYRYVGTCDGPVTIGLCNADFDTRLAVYGAFCPAGPGLALACSDDACGDASQVAFDAATGTIYRVRVGGANGASGSGEIAVTCGGLPCSGDTDADGTVNVTDLVNVIVDWGCLGSCLGDVNDDGVVNVSDLLAVILGWGEC